MADSHVERLLVSADARPIGFPRRDAMPGFDNRRCGLVSTSKDKEVQSGACENGALEEKPTEPVYIVNVRGLGYCFENPEENMTKS